MQGFDNPNASLPCLGRPLLLLALRRACFSPRFVHNHRPRGSASCARLNKDYGSPGAESAPPVASYRPVESRISSSLVQRRAHAAQSALPAACTTQVRSDAGGLLDCCVLPLWSGRHSRYTESMSACKQHSPTAPPFTDMALRAQSTVPQRFETKDEQMQRGRVHEHVVQNEKEAEQPGLVPERRGYRARSCCEHILLSAECAAAPPFRTDRLRGGPEADGDETARSRWNVDTRAPPA